jgi:hypothetical protein
MFESQMQTTAKHIASLLLVTTLVPSFAIAQSLFKDLRDKMKQAIPSEPARAQGQMQLSPTQGRQDGIGKVCSGLVLPPSKRSKEDVESLLRLHFKVGSNEFFNEAYAAVATNSGASPAVSHLSLFSNNFESERANALYAAFLSWPEPEVMAEIIAATSDKNDQQLANDATVMLILILRSMPNAAINPQSWKSMVPGLEQKEHIPSACLSARFLATGETGRQSIKLATSEYTRCANLPSTYQGPSRHIPVTIDFNSFIQADLIPQTLFLLFQVNQAETVKEMSRINPSAIQQMLQMFGQIVSAQKQFRDQYYQTPTGALTKVGIQAASTAEQKGTALISSSQQMSRAFGDFQANISQQSRQGSREGAFVGDPAIHIRMNGQAAVFKNAEEVDAKAMSEVRHYQGASALALGRAKGVLDKAVLQQIMNGSIVGGASMIPVLRDISISSVRACRSFNSFQQAARAKNISTADDDKDSAAMLQSMMANK